MKDANQIGQFGELFFNLCFTVGEDLKQYNFSIISLEISFNDSSDKTHFEALNKFNENDEIIFINEKMERYVNGLIHFKNPIINILNDITISNGKNDSKLFLWTNATVISTAQPNVVAHYVVTEL